jgi:tetratricopeptide (TPR) repeat protein
LNAANNYASALWGLGRAAEGVPVFRATWQAQREVLGELHPQTLISEANLGVNLRDTGQAEEALLHMRAAYAQRSKAPEVAFLGLELPALLAAQGQFAEVAALVPAAVAEARARHAAGSLELAADLVRLADALLRAQQWTEAEALLREAVAIRSAKEPDGWRVAVSHALLGAALLGQQRFAEAEPLLVGGAEALLARAESVPPPARFRVREAVQRVVDFYARADVPVGEAVRAEKGALWRARLAELPPGR